MLFFIKCEHFSSTLTANLQIGAQEPNLSTKKTKPRSPRQLSTPILKTQHMYYLPWRRNVVVIANGTEDRWFESRQGVGVFRTLTLHCFFVT
jgi:hypothetical protein